MEAAWVRGRGRGRKGSCKLWEKERRPSMLLKCQGERGLPLRESPSMMQAVEKERGEEETVLLVKLSG